MFEMLEARRLLAVGDVYSPPGNPRVAMDLNASWKFLRADAASAQSPGFNDSSWGTVSVPHSWNNLDGQDGGNNYYRGIGWYRKTINVPSSFSGKSVFLQLDGSSLNTDVYVDGNLIGSHSGGFAAFNFDVTSALLPGSHLIAVKVSNAKAISSTVIPKDGDFTINGGIYRDVSLIGMDKRHIAPNDFASSGVQFSTPAVSESQATAQVRTKLRNVSQSNKTMVVTTRIVDASNIIVGEMINSQLLASGASFDLTQSTTIANPRLWHGRVDPYLHKLFIEVRDGSTNQLYDFMHQRVGIRSYQISPTQGFLLNGQPYLLNGVNAHQDRLNKGWAISDADIQQDISLILEVGATMLRAAHYQHSQLTYDLCDQYGLVVWAEIPLVNSAANWYLPSAQQQLTELIRQNFNHPSIVVWGLQNEVFNDADAQNTIAVLNTQAKLEDPTRLTTSASHHSPLSVLESTPDTAALNRYHGWYYGVPADLGTLLDDAHASFPNLPLGISEYGAGGSIHQHQPNATTVVPWGYYHPEEFQSHYHEQSWPVLATRDYLWSRLIWNMFDFAADHRAEGDAFGINDKGLITHDRGTKKDAFYYYKANWSDQPVLHITSRRWTNRISENAEIKVYSNLDNVQLTVNGKPVAMNAEPYHIHLNPSIRLVPGNNTIAVTGVRDGQSYSDSVVWNYIPPLSIAAGTGSVKINFAPSDGGAMPAGYAIDTGATFGTRSNGKRYGWNFSNNTTRRRNLDADPRFDTLIHMQKDGDFGIWEYELANGTYDVFIASGDPLNTDSTNNLNIEGREISDINGLTHGDQMKARVSVSDGRLTIKPGLGAMNAKLQFVEFSAVTDLTPPTVTGSAFEFESGYVIRVSFSEGIDVSTLATGDLVIGKVGSSEEYFAESVSYETESTTAVFWLGALPDGNYTATLPGGSVGDTAANFNAASHTTGAFFVLAGDADRNRLVDTRDFNRLAGVFGKSPAIFSEGDFSFDNAIDSVDFGILVDRFGKRVS